MWDLEALDDLERRRFRRLRRFTKDIGLEDSEYIKELEELKDLDALVDLKDRWNLEDLGE